VGSREKYARPSGPTSGPAEAGPREGGGEGGSRREGAPAETGSRQVGAACRREAGRERAAEIIVSQGAVVPGAVAPDFDFPLLGGGYQELRDLVHPGGGIVVFFKTECATSALLLSHIGPLAQALQSEERVFLAVAQNGEEEARQFRDEHLLQFPIACEKSPYPASRAYDVQTVPTLFVIDGAGRIAERVEGFLKSEVLALGPAVEQALALGDIPPVLENADELPDIRPG
jgi:peroxiredoxin